MIDYEEIYYELVLETRLADDPMKYALLLGKALGLIWSMLNDDPGSFELSEN